MLIILLSYSCWPFCLLSPSLTSNLSVPTIVKEDYPRKKMKSNRFANSMLVTSHWELGEEGRSLPQTCHTVCPSEEGQEAPGNTPLLAQPGPLKLSCLLGTWYSFLSPSPIHILPWSQLSSESIPLHPTTQISSPWEMPNILQAPNQIQDLLSPNCSCPHLFISTHKCPLIHQLNTCSFCHFPPCPSLQSSPKVYHPEASGHPPHPNTLVTSGPK